jgi:hypothetical protein
MGEVKVDSTLVELGTHDACVVHVVKQLRVLLLALVCHRARAVILKLSHPQQLVEFLDAVQVHLNSCLSVH